ATCDSVKSFFACIEARSTKAVFSSDKLSDEMLMTLSSVNLDNNVQEGLEELNEKSLSTQGYLDSEVLFNIPTIGVSDKELEFLEEYIVDGSINMEKLRSGEEVLILITTGTDPFSVGQTLSMTDVVIDDPIIEEYDFTTGYVPDGYEPHFYYDYTDNADMTNLPGYAFGARCDYEVTVGGHIEISDHDIAQFFQTQGEIGDCGFNILCSENAFSKWGLPDRNYTKLGVSLEDHVPIADFERLWYNVMGNSKDISNTSQAFIIRQMNNVEAANISIFFSIIAIVVILGLVGMSNSINLRVRRQLHAYSVLRAVGCSKAGLVFMILRQGLIYVLIGSITSFLPLWIFEQFRKKAIAYAAQGSSMLLPENGRFNIPWHSLFPTRIELFHQPLILIIPTVFLIVCFIILISNVLPAIWVIRKNITDALKNDDF
ncbi:MAG: ABC transporter permease, partial [Lachnospiraceae bacterium]|nr:ABC transporter permease [Lachnospiraceae bacterium]